MSGVDLPYSEPVRRHQVGAGVTRRLEPDAAARARIAKALDLASLDAFVAEVTLAPAPAGWRLSGRMRGPLSPPIWWPGLGSAWRSRPILLPGSWHWRRVPQ